MPYGVLASQPNRSRSLGARFRREDMLMSLSAKTTEIESMPPRDRYPTLRRAAYKAAAPVAVV